jgi:alanine racemase
VPAEGVHRPTWAEISTSAVTHNARAVKRVVGERSICAVIKADAYGHGAITVAKAALEGGVDCFAVALIDEGIELRNAGVTVPILLLAEVVPPTIPLALAHDLTLTVGSLEGALAAVASAEEAGGVHRVHVKVDTGMHRMGVAPESIDEVVDTLRASPAIDVEGLFSHFAVADGSSAEDHDFTRLQIERFNEVAEGLRRRGVVPRVLHLANSAGTMGYPDARLSMVRPGLCFLGYVPEEWLEDALDEVGESLEPALTLRTRVIAVRRLAAGERPSYGRRLALARDATVVTVPIGYADGYPRVMFEGGAEVLIKGRRYPLAGQVTMDQLVINVGDDDVAVGDEVVLLGRDGQDFISAHEWGQWSNSVLWEALARIGTRVPRVVVD